MECAVIHHSEIITLQRYGVPFRPVGATSNGTSVCNMRTLLEVASGVIFTQMDVWVNGGANKAEFMKVITESPETTPITTGVGN